MGTQEVENEVKTFASGHKRLVAEIVGALLLLLLGIGIGHFKPVVKTQTVTVTKTEVQTKVEYKDRVQVQKVYVQVEKKHEHTETTTTKKPDGTVETKVVQDENTDTDTDVNTTKDEQRQSTTNQTIKQDVKQKTLTLAQPNWRLTLGAGVDIPSTLLGHEQGGIPGMRGFVLQAGVDRRIAGPVWMGLFGNTEGIVGLDLGLTL